MSRVLLIGLLAIAVGPVDTALAEEGGGGHYLPGTISSSLDGVSAEPVFITRLNVIDYRGDFGAARRIPIAGQTVLDVEAESTAAALTFFWRPEWATLTEKIGLAANLTIPFLRMKVEADVEVGGGRTVRRSDTEYGLGDIIVTPFMLNYQATPDLALNTRLNVYAPSGDYEVGRLANLGRNYWSFEPMVGLVYLGQENGREASLHFGATFNEENDDTDYETGTQLHLDGTLAQHFPLFGGVAGAGVTGYWYQQVEDDSGAGATLGAFRGRTHGIGPTLMYSRLFGSHRFVSELKWVHELDSRNRPEGDLIVLKAMLTF